MKAPTMIYKCESVTKITEMDLQHKVVDAEDVKSELKNGWFETPAEAKESAEKPRRSRSANRGKKNVVD